ncbi:MAG TPA: GTPase ObgE [Fibrobacteraceae bacterium]|nr:GTPase ObgE [Fibrobacteraceae bacterium]
MFLDETTIEVISGKGGEGICSFRREACVPNGGPDGGDGGRGGSVYLRVNEQYTTLLDMGNQRKYKAENGVRGATARCSGKNAPDLLVDVPVGTLVKDEEGRILADLVLPGQLWLAAPGGRGGMGNQHFATPKNQAPRKTIPPQLGTQRILHLELKLMADVGLVGFPNAGKSSLVNRISSARPKVGDYPFTTLEPILGIVHRGERSFVVADIPGLIEGAAEGKGLGYQFLRHIERTHTLLFVIDGFEDDAYTKYKMLCKELEAFHPALAEKQRVIAINKTDLGVDKVLKEFRRHKLPVVSVSAVTGEGCQALVDSLLGMLPSLRQKGWH